MKAVLMAMALMAAVAQHTVSAHTSHGVDEATAVTIVHQAVPQLVVKDLGFEVGQLDARQVNASRHGDPDLARQLGGQLVELQRTKQAEDGLRHLTQRRRSRCPEARQPADDWASEPSA